MAAQMLKVERRLWGKGHSQQRLGLPQGPQAQRSDSTGGINLRNGVCGLPSSQLCPLEPSMPLLAFTYWVPLLRVSQLHPSALQPVCHVSLCSLLLFPLCCSSVAMLETHLPSNFAPLPPSPGLSDTCMPMVSHTCMQLNTHVHKSQCFKDVLIRWV